MGDTRVSCRVLVGRLEGKRALRRLGVGGRMITQLLYQPLHIYKFYKFYICAVVGITIE